MTWNWQQPDWPNFSFDNNALGSLETQFLHQAGVLSGAIRHVGDADKKHLTVDLLTNEAVKTSEIEGEYLNRDSVQSSIRRQFGLQSDNHKIPPAERGIAEMILDVYQTFSAPLTAETLFKWHEEIMKGRRDLDDVGKYRTHPEPMQVVSGTIHNPTVHFEAPPSKEMASQMETFISWFNKTAPNGPNPLPPMTRAGIAHLYFVCIHPFEDGNGRIGRAISQKALSQCLGQATLIALSQTIQSNRKAYYAALEANNKTNEITNWLLYFSQTIIDAQRYTQNQIDFLIEKTKLYEKLRSKLNSRQEKVLSRMFREGLEGFKGGLSADNYIKIAKTSRATATRDLHELVEFGALTRTGERKSTRYYLNIKAK